MLGKKLGVDLGSGTTRVTTRTEGLLFTEPTVVARRAGSAHAVSAGSAAVDAAAGGGLTLEHPLRGGDVDDRDGLSLLVQHIVSRAVGRQRIFKPDMVIAVRAGMSSEDRQVVLDASMHAGARTVYLIDVPIAAAMGAGLPLAESRPSLIVDIGAGKTDVAAVVGEGMVSVRSLPVGGDDLLDAARHEVAARHGRVLDRDGVDVLRGLLVAAPHEERTAEANGVLLSSHDLAGVVADHVAAISRAVRDVLEDTPQRVLASVRDSGAVLTGGAAQLEGLPRQLAAQTGVASRVAPNPDGCTMRGTSMAVDNLDVLKRSFLYMR